MTATRIFLPLRRAARARLAEDETIRDLYADALALIHDLLCEFAGGHGGPRFPDPAGVEHDLRSLTHGARTAPPRSPADTLILRNIEENRDRALSLRLAAV